MTHVICRATSCVFWEQGVCSLEEMEYEPDVGCLNFQDMGDLELEEDEDELDWEDTDGDFFADDDDDDWDDEDEEWSDDNL